MSCNLYKSEAAYLVYFSIMPQVLFKNKEEETSHRPNSFSQQEKTAD